MSNKKSFIVILLFIGLLIGELHQFFNGLSIKEVHWFIDPPKNIPTLHWWSKDVGSILQRLIWMDAFFIAAKMIDRRLSAVVSIFVIYCLLDALLYVVCYQMYGYSVVYGIMGLFAFIILRRK